MMRREVIGYGKVVGRSTMGIELVGEGFERVGTGKTDVRVRTGRRCESVTVRLDQRVFPNTQLLDLTSVG